ncbi:MAG: aminotransferase [Spirochaetae bacterium HGW-Spirochaetae-6]|nr:MAG: aminotransferase [Spirochaetae bacterium HGW-Spirochaetae-6]
MDIRFSERLLRLPPYIFGKLNALKLQLRREGKDIIDLGMGNPDKGAPLSVVEKTKEVLSDAKSHRYSRSKGIPHLLKEVAGYYKRKYGVELEPEKEIVATIGSKEGISHLCLALLGPGDSALVPSPAFPIHLWGVVLAGANVISFSMEKVKENFITHLIHTYELLWPKPKVLFLNFPHNPTTTVVDKAFYQEVVDFAIKKELIIISDFAYADITFDGYRAPSILEVPRAKEVAVEFITMSKSFSMAGWRVGFCLGNEKIVQALEKIKGYYDYGIFTPVQVGAIMALKNEWEHAPGEYAKIYEQRRDMLVDGLNKIGWQITKPKATMFVWSPIPEKYRHVGSIRFSRFLLEEAEVCVSPGLSFGEEGEGFLRISLVENEKRIQQAVKQIKKAMDKMTPEQVMEKYPANF